MKHTVVVLDVVVVVVVVRLIHWVTVFFDRVLDHIALSLPLCIV